MKEYEKMSQGTGENKQLSESMDNTGKGKLEEDENKRIKQICAEIEIIDIAMADLVEKKEASLNPMTQQFERIKDFDLKLENLKNKREELVAEIRGEIVNTYIENKNN